MQYLPTGQGNTSLKASLTILGDFLHFGQLYKSSGMNYLFQNAHIYVKVSKSFIFLVKSYLATFIDIWWFFSGYTAQGPMRPLNVMPLHGEGKQLWGGTNVHNWLNTSFAPSIWLAKAYLRRKSYQNRYLSKVVPNVDLFVCSLLGVKLSYLPSWFNSCCSW